MIIPENRPMKRKKHSRKWREIFLPLLLAGVLCLSAGCARTDSQGAPAASQPGQEQAPGADVQESALAVTGRSGAPAEAAQAGTKAEAQPGTDMSDRQADSARADTPAGGELRDGTYVPAVFRARGGTGKVRITCPEVVVADGSAVAAIVFSSPHYAWVEAEGVRYDPEDADGADRETSVFRIPVRLGEETEISGLTTAMSEPHEVAYTLYVSLEEAGDGDDALDAEPEDAAPARGADAQGKAAEAGSPVAQPEGAGTADAEAGAEGAGESDQAKGAGALAAGDLEPPALPGMAYVSSMKTEYAEEFAVHDYVKAPGSEKSGIPEAEADSPAAAGTKEGDYRLIEVRGSGRYLLVPEGGEVPDGLPRGITVLHAFPGTIYVAATSSMALFDKAGALAQVKFTGTREDGWYIDAPKEALASGTMAYAGRYSAPDYERLAASGCDLAVESMMILHAPEVKEKLEELGIPVFIDTSSAEGRPLGRTEWVRLYGVLTGHEAEADAFFAAQKERFAEAEDYADTGLTVAFFSLSSTGNVIVRAADDYIPRMIGLAGGRYIFTDLVSGTGRSASVRLSMEDFYNTAKDADYLIYNATIESPVGSLAELLARSALFSDFRAVEEGHVWQVRRSLYQSPDIAAQLIGDIHRMLTGEGASGMDFLEPVE